MVALYLHCYDIMILLIKVISLPYLRQYLRIFISPYNQLHRVLQNCPIVYCTPNSDRHSDFDVEINLITS